MKLTFSGTTKRLSGSRIFGRVRVLITLILLAALIMGGYLLWRHKDSTTTAKMPGTSFVYKNLAPYYLRGKSAGFGIKLEIPKVFSSALGPVGQYPQISINQTELPSGPLPVAYQPVQMAHFAAASLYADSSFTSGYKSGYGDSLKSTSGQSGLQDFIGQRLPSGYLVSIGSIKNFNSSNLKDNAWAVEYTAKAKPGQSTNALPDLTGEVIVALGKQATYYVMLDAVSANWQGSQNTWQQVVNSIKIDQ